MQYRIIRSSRRTVALVVNTRGDLIVRAPKKTSLEVIERFIGLKRTWIERNIAKAKQYHIEPKKNLDGEQFLFLGEQRPLKFLDEYGSRLRYNGGRFELSRYQRHKADRLFTEWYQTQAKELLPKRAAYWAHVMSLKYKNVMVTSATTRWGSCSSRGTINFSWHLVKTPLEVIDYVVIHELAHLVYHDHSSNFWRLVERFCPDFRDRKQWLNRQGRYLIERLNVQV